MGMGIPGGYAGKGTPGKDTDTCFCTQHHTRTLTRQTHTRRCGFDSLKMMCVFYFYIYILIFAYLFVKSPQLEHQQRQTTSLKEQPPCNRHRDGHDRDSRGGMRTASE